MTEDNFSSKQTRFTPIPKTEAELLNRCEIMAGQTLGQIAFKLSMTVPEDLRLHKGWVGHLCENYLGANAGDRAEPDFLDIGVELKTLPVDAHEKPKESTYVCTMPIRQIDAYSWQNSWVKRKLSRVLWVPVEAARDIPLAERYVDNFWIWRPSFAEECSLQRDWEELMDRIVLGEQAEITSQEGEYLHIRPKAANSLVLVRGMSNGHTSAFIIPKGFYLRTSFTGPLLHQSLYN
ncbi:MAG: DNA mismatch repair endonuclease MutH [Piscirickettsiaceae bacterium]|nr:DNA mismatch repair endonuclease MutH [Piscirickettsiaceae bacterium]